MHLSIPPCGNFHGFPQKFRVFHYPSVDIHMTFPQAVEKSVDKIKFSKGYGGIFCGIFQNPAPTREIDAFSAGSLLPGLWRSRFSPPTVSNVSRLFQQLPVGKSPSLFHRNRPLFYPQRQPSRPENTQNAKVRRLFGPSSGFSRKIPQETPAVSTGAGLHKITKTIVTHRFFVFPHFPPPIRILLLV